MFDDKDENRLFNFHHEWKDKEKVEKKRKED